MPPPARKNTVAGPPLRRAGLRPRPVGGHPRSRHPHRDVGHRPRPVIGDDRRAALLARLPWLLPRSSGRRALHSFPTRRSSDLLKLDALGDVADDDERQVVGGREGLAPRSEEHTADLQSQSNLVCRLLLEKTQSLARLYGELACDRVLSAATLARGTRTEMSGIDLVLSSATTVGLRFSLDCHGFFHEAAAAELYTLSLHDALPIF